MLSKKGIDEDLMGYARPDLQFIQVVMFVVTGCLGKAKDLTEGGVR